MSDNLSIHLLGRRLGSFGTVKFSIMAQGTPKQGKEYVKAEAMLDLGFQLGGKGKNGEDWYRSQSDRCSRCVRNKKECTIRPLSIFEITPTYTFFDRKKCFHCSNTQHPCDMATTGPKKRTLRWQGTTSHMYCGRETLRLVQFTTKIPEPVHQHDDEPPPRSMLTEEHLQHMQMSKYPEDGDIDTSKQAPDSPTPAMLDWLSTVGKEVERQAPSKK